MLEHMIMHLERLRETTLAQIGTSEGALDGPFIMPSGTFGLLVSLRGKDGGSMPSPSELYWGRDVPRGAANVPVHVFLRHGDRAVYLGTARFARRGKPATDGFKVAFSLVEPLEESQWRELVAQANAAPPPAPEEAIASLGKPNTTDQRIAAMRVFVERWHETHADFTEPEGPKIAPRPLRAFYRFTAGKNVCIQNRIVTPDELALESESKKLTFYVENQGVCLWATESLGDDPPVYVRSNEWDAPWRKEADSLSGFLIQMLVLEATFGAPFGVSHDGLDARALAKLAKRVLPLPIPPWASSRTRFFGSGGVIGFAYPDGKDFAVWLGAKDRVRMEPLEKLLADWPDVRF